MTTNSPTDLPTDHPTGSSIATGLPEPVPPDWRRRLRRAVVEHARSPGRRHRPQLHVGEPGGVDVRLDIDATEPSDPGLRTDLVAAMLAEARREGVEQPLVWLTRSGDLAAQDVDAQWLAACCAAAQESRQPVVLVVVTRHGWRDPRSGAEQTWVRLRPWR